MTWFKYFDRLAAMLGIGLLMGVALTVVILHL